MTDYAAELCTALKLLNDDLYNECVSKCGCILESSLRDAIHNVRKRLKKVDEEQAIIDVEAEIGQGKSMNEFGLGKLVNLYMNARIGEMLQRQLPNPMNRSKGIDWGMAVELRNDVTHNHEDRLPVSPEDAMQLYLWTSYFARETGLYEGEMPEPQRISTERAAECDRCGENLDEAWSYCPYCGLTLDRTCSNCGRSIERSDWRVCPYCEAELEPLNTEEKERARREYTLLCRGVWADNIMNRKERDFLEDRRRSLGLDFSEARDLETKEAPEGPMKLTEILEALRVTGNLEPEERKFIYEKGRMLGLDEEEIGEIIRTTL